jgi:hypothetical protein
VKRLKISSANEDVAKDNFCILLVGKEVSTATVENSMEVPQKTKNDATM